MHRFPVPISKLKALRSPEVKKEKKNPVSAQLEAVTSKNSYPVAHKASRQYDLEFSHCQHVSPLGPLGDKK